MIKRELYLIDNLYFVATKRHLNDLQKKIIARLLLNWTYKEIALDCNYDDGYIGDKARKLFKILSAEIGEDVNKYNFCWVIERMIDAEHATVR